MFRRHGADAPGAYVGAISMLLLTLALVFGVVTVARADDPVVFADANLRSAVVDQLVSQGRVPHGSDGTTLTPSDLRSLTTLDAADRGITRLDGLEDAVDLASLDLRGNEIADMGPVAGLKNLTDLDVTRNRLDVTAGLSQMSALDALETLGVRVRYRPQRPSLSPPIASSSAGTYGKAALFSATMAPARAAVEGTSQARFYHLETKTVTRRVGRTTRRVSVTYWRLRATVSAEGTSTGTVSARVTLPYAGKWQAVFTVSGSADYEACTSTVCTLVVRDPRIEAAVSWGSHRRGAHLWDHYCLRFVNDSYERGAHAAVIRTRTARQAAVALHASANRSFNAPRGAYVFYDSWHGRVNLGHVGISLGNGMMVNAYGGKGVVIMPIRNTMHYTGWAPPPLSSRITDWDTPPAD